MMFNGHLEFETFLHFSLALYFRLVLTIGDVLVMYYSLVGAYVCC